MLEKTVAQTTIAKEVSLKGVGLHTGAEVTITFKPAMENTGYRFKRVDLEETLQRFKQRHNMLSIPKGVQI
jgi:UDP-3-O-[3-hydroxymyristoyl] N-acetylglucosamine deacetylase/3-hydroxyacyl-[acyl-carrier-protein] dehydratase